MFRSDRYPDPWTLTGPLPPSRIETPRLVLRCWEPADAPRFQASLRANREHIGAWIPPARDEPSELPAIERRLTRFRSEFHAGVAFVYALFDPSETEVLGEAGLALPEVDRIEIHCDPGNAPSAAVPRKLPGVPRRRSSTLRSGRSRTDDAYARSSRP